MTSAADAISEAEAVARAAHAAGRVAVDTEFVSERRYQSQLCLVQAGAPAGDGIAAALVDPIEGDQPPRALLDALSDPAVEVLMHAGRQDVALLKRAYGVEIRNLFDTQVAAGFVGLGTQVGYADLAQRLLGVKVARAEGFTRWDVRPLTEDQLAYAREDVLHLPAIADALQDRLRAAGRLEWAREECRPLEEVSDVRDEESAYRKLPRLGGLSGKARAIAREIVRWREDAARAADRPPSALLPDHVLVDLAKRAPRDRTALDSIRGLPQQTLHRRHRELLEAIERGRSAEPIAHAEERTFSEAADQPLIALAQALVRHRTQEAKLASELVATQADLGRIVPAVRRGDGEPDVRTLKGWRRELVGEELLELLRGRRTVGVADGRLRVDPA